MPLEEGSTAGADRQPSPSPIPDDPDQLLTVDSASVTVEMTDEPDRAPAALPSNDLDQLSNGDGLTKCEDPVAAAATAVQMKHGLVPEAVVRKSKPPSNHHQQQQNHHHLHHHHSHHYTPRYYLEQEKDHPDAVSTLAELLHEPGLQASVHDILNDGEEDQMFITGYVRCPRRTFLCYLGFLLTFGILRLVMHWQQHWLLRCTHRKCSLEYAEKVLIHEAYQRRRSNQLSYGAYCLSVIVLI